MNSKMKKWENRIVGELQLGKGKCLHFMITEFNQCVKYAHIRMFVETNRYTGYTKQGIIMSGAQLKKLIGILNSCRKANKQAGEIGTIPNSENCTIVVRIVNDSWTGNKPKLDIRRHIKSDKYHGWAKSGFRADPSEIERIIYHLNELNIIIQKDKTALMDQLQDTILADLYEEFK